MLRLIISLYLLAACFSSPVWAAATDKSRRVLSLPILYVTDRDKTVVRGDHQDFGVQMIEPVDALYYGCQQVKLKVTAEEAEEMTPLPLWGWSLRSEKDEKIGEAQVAQSNGSTGQNSTVETTESLSSSTSVSTEAGSQALSAAEETFKNQVFDKTDEFERLVASLRKAMEINKRREFIIFVHGCCIGFEGSMNQAAALEEATRIPVVAYAWGSVKGNYGGSTMTYPRSQERFNGLVRRLLKEFPDEKITLAGNSVGNMMIVEYCLETCEHSELRKFDNIILSRADMDAFAFKTQVKHVVRAGKHVSLYVAKNDPQINISGVLRWFFNPKDGSERVGNTRSAPMYKCDQPVVVYDVSALKMKHIMPHRAVSELLNNDGCAPADSPVYIYQAEKDNVVRVLERSGKSAERKFANAVGE